MIFSADCYCRKKATHISFVVRSYSIQRPFHEIHTDAGQLIRATIGGMPRIQAECDIFSHCSEHAPPNSFGYIFTCPVDQKIEEELIKISATQQQREINL